MLDSLNIKNLVVVEDLDIDFKSGMTVITGETGAGKSIIVQALAMIAGRRSDASLVRKGAQKAEITASFSIESNPSVLAYLEGQDLENDFECIIRRVILSDGKSHSYINGSKVPLSVLSEVGGFLIDMHGQNEHQLLLRPSHHRILLDDYAGSQKMCNEVNDIVNSYQKIKGKIDHLRNNNSLLSAQKDLVIHQLNELHEAELSVDELSSIEDDYKASKNSSQLTEKISKILSALNDDHGVNNILIDGETVLEQSKEIDSRLDSIRALIAGAQLQVQEGIYDLTDYLTKISSQEDNSMQLEQRITFLHDLGRKHNCQIKELINIQQSLEKSLRELDSSNETLDKLNEELNQLETEYYIQSTELSAKRKKASNALSEEVTSLMQKLGMPGSEIIFRMVDLDKEVRLNGAEDINIHVKTNAGQDFKPLNKIASGGELSRVSLALSVSGSNTELTPSVVFDEVDVGISGSVAEIVGQMLKQLAKHYQVICVTHLAQVAAQGNHHLKVEKIQKNDMTFTEVVSLNREQRADEIARILGGIKISEKTRIAAEEMISSGS